MNAELTSDRVARLVSAAATVAGQPDLRAVLRTTVHTAMELTGAGYGALGILGEHGTLVDFIHAGLAPATVEQIGRYPEGRGLLGTLTRIAKPLRLDNLTDHPDSVGFPDHHPAMATFLGVPVRIGEAVFGNLYLCDKEGGFTEDDEALVEALALIAGSAISTARLNQRIQRAAVVEDRERIAREIHDGVIQNLFAIGLSLQGTTRTIETRPAFVRERISDATSQLDDAITTLRRYIFDLRTNRLGAKSLEAEIRLMAEGVLDATELETSFDFTGSFDGFSDGSVEDACLLVREALSNASRHSGAKRVTIVGNRRGDWVSIEIRDDGKGFDTAAEAGGLGLRNMQRRAAQMGGVLDVDSRPGAGTVVRAEFPVR